MTPCEELEPRVLAYQLGACEPQLRDELDAHLLTCIGCLTRFLAQKRVCEDAAAFDQRPSPALHPRLRAAVLARRAHRPRSRAVWVMGLAAVLFALAGALWTLRPASAPSLERPADLNGLVDAPTTQAASSFL